MKKVDVAIPFARASTAVGDAQVEVALSVRQSAMQLAEGVMRVRAFTIVDTRADGVPSLLYR